MQTLGTYVWALPLALLAVILPVIAEADVCGDLVLMHWGADGWACVNQSSVEELEKRGFYLPEIPLPVVEPGNTPRYACPALVFDIFSVPVTGAAQEMATSAQFRMSSPAGLDYSTTNIQEVGVDEPDIIKNTATEIFVAGNRMDILRAYPPGDAGVLGHSLVTGEMLLHGDKLAVFERGGDTKITILDISNKTDPDVVDHILITGTMTEARLINGTIYVVTQDFLTDRAPSVRHGTNTLDPMTHYFPYYPADTRTMITAVSLESGVFDAVSFLTPSTTEIYASESNMYLVMHGIGEYWIPEGPGPAQTCASDTKIAKIGLSDASLSYEGEGMVPGYPIDQFAMSEKDDTFRIATTTWSGINSAFKLNETLDIIGEVRDIAPGETMHSARFYGDTLYLVTFRQVDPFFVIDFSGDPKVLGELKLPGFSEYLHPYDSDTVLGVGRETVEGQWGPVLDGVKITVFDVSDPADPTLADFTVIGDWSAYSHVMDDHKAALVSQTVISIPVSFDGNTTFHVYGIEGGMLAKKGLVQHEKASWARSLYIGDYLYTLTPEMLKITNLNGFVFVNSVPLNLLDG